VWPGVASGLDTVSTTEPYYRSTYVFVSRETSALAHLTLDDPRLRQNLVGVQMIGNDATNTPPAHAIASRGITDNVRGYMLVGDYGRPSPAAVIVDAVAHGDIDVALVWGPPAGYFAKISAVPLRIDAILKREKSSVDAILRSYGVPLSASPVAAENFKTNSAPSPVLRAERCQ
jgi:mxaJ protein